MQSSFKGRRFMGPMWILVDRYSWKYCRKDQVYKRSNYTFWGVEIIFQMNRWYGSSIHNLNTLINSLLSGSWILFPRAQKCVWTEGKKLLVFNTIPYCSGLPRVELATGEWKYYVTTLAVWDSSVNKIKIGYETWDYQRSR